ncbi:hypothetical protein RhiirA4_452162 [Rhizophagus irregularis]|uniref:Uncharacterized protein n=1 Tax=Rhizophagus irregularis TaxID=588596 RepID=A0A2I1FXC3_9GLOM|nr:hypothetical protein RhiirA4_452162 [Rhizophagus irregularis]
MNFHGKYKEYYMNKYLMFAVNIEVDIFSILLMKKKNNLLSFSKTNGDIENIKVKEEKLAPKPTESMIMEGESKVQEELGDSPRPRSCDSETGNRRSYMFIITLTSKTLEIT